MTASGLVCLAIALWLLGASAARANVAAADRAAPEQYPQARTGLSVFRPFRRPGRMAPTQQRALALLLDLIAAALESGLPCEAAVEAVSLRMDRGIAPQLADALLPLERVGRLLRWGEDPVQAWASIAELPGYESVAAAGRRCADSGARLAGALSSTAVQLRLERQAGAIAAANRVGIWSLLPLGLCFLPAFVCIGIVPVVGGLAGQLLTKGGS